MRRRPRQEGAKVTEGRAKVLPRRGDGAFVEDVYKRRRRRVVRADGVQGKLPGKFRLPQAGVVVLALGGVEEVQVVWVGKGALDVVFRRVGRQRDTHGTLAAKRVERGALVDLQPGTSSGAWLVGSRETKERKNK